MHMTTMNATKNMGCPISTLMAELTQMAPWMSTVNNTGTDRERKVTNMIAKIAKKEMRLTTTVSPSNAVLMSR